METSIIIAGFGGQGVLFAGQLLAYAGMKEGKQVTWIPSYGPAMRGGTASCTAIISDDVIGAPLVAQPDVAIVLNLPSFEKYEPLVKEKGLLIVNSSIVTEKAKRPEIETVYLPANSIAEEVGTSKMLNVATIGAMLARRPILDLDVVREMLVEHLSKKKAQLVDANLQVLNRGYEAGLLVAA